MLSQNQQKQLVNSLTATDLLTNQTTHTTIIKHHYKASTPQPTLQPAIYTQCWSFANILNTEKTSGIDGIPSFALKQGAGGSTLQILSDPFPNKLF